MINPAIFNSEKSDYLNTPIILGESRGLFDTMTKQYPKQTELYYKLRSQDWTEKEFIFEVCKVEFKTRDPIYARDMRRALGYQWEQDSVAASTIAGIMACVCSSTEIFTGYQRISDNEAVHAQTYAEIVNQSFDDPIAAMEEFKAEKDAMERMEAVSRTFEQAFISAHRWALYKARPDLYPLTDKERYDIYDHIFMYVVALLVMERVQFMSSFATTFGICEMNWFQPIGDAVQRIALDELEIHVPFGRANLISMMATDRGREAFKNNRHLIIQLLNESVRAENRWVEVVHDDGHELEKAPPGKLIEFNHFCGTDVAAFFGLRGDVDFPMVDNNCLPFMHGRLNLSSVQATPQEAPPTAYLVNALVRNDAGRVFDFTM